MHDGNNIVTLLKIVINIRNSCFFIFKVNMLFILISYLYVFSLTYNQKDINNVLLVNYNNQNISLVGHIVKSLDI